MKLKTLLIINAIVAAAFGIAFVLVPDQVMSLYDIEASAILSYTGQLLGAAFIGFAILTWSARNADDSTARRAIVLAFFIGNGVGFAVALIGQLNDVVSALGWSSVAIYLLFALGYGYFQFLSPAPQEAPHAAT
jgi:hypothetical protein